MFIPNMSKRILFTIATCLIIIWVASSNGASNSGVVRIGSEVFNAEYALTDQSRQKGLSGRTDFSANSAMVFVFDKTAQRCFWMKDMNFAIDIVWLDDKKRVVAHQQNVQPNSYPSTYCHEGTQYVVEFAAGTTNRLGLNPGDVFDL